MRAPEGEMAIVFSDITRAASLWEFNAEAMRDATLLHNELMRSLLQKHRGYEVIFIRYPVSLMFFLHSGKLLIWRGQNCAGTGTAGRARSAWPSRTRATRSSGAWAYS